ncbi:pilus assembly protein [Iodidimonas muriae]|uniref:Pilus assembly protein n=1 Tax=Iodidimonas muriae TaxID=261467 RepID=A0ABQ2LEX5_9PROT|nr:type II secretion system F family protein [Iodidimonas muriae]GGO14390.1 pilus assembly protein [Iodidimonas muriae]
MASGNDTLLIALIFGASLLIFGTLAAAFLFSGTSDKRVRARLTRYRAKYGPSGGVSRARSILADQDNSSPFEAMLARFVPRPESFRKRLQKTGKDIPVGRYAIICAVVLLVSSLVMMLFFSLPFALSLLLGVVIGIGLPHFIVSRMIAKREKQFLALFPEAIELIVRGLKSGLPINETISIVGSEVEDPVGTEFRKIADQVRFGKTLEDAMWRAADRLDFPDFKFFVISLAIQRETGGNLAETLGNLSNILRSRHQMKLKIKALSSEGRASAMIIGCLPFIMFAIIYAMNADYASTFFTDPRAMIVLFGALIWMGLGGFIISKMISFEI